VCFERSLWVFRRKVFLSNWWNLYVCYLLFHFIFSCYFIYSLIILFREMCCVIGGRNNLLLLRFSIWRENINFCVKICPVFARASLLFRTLCDVVTIYLVLMFSQSWVMALSLIDTKNLGFFTWDVGETCFILWFILYYILFLTHSGPVFFQIQYMLSCCELLSALNELILSFKSLASV